MTNEPRSSETNEQASGVAIGDIDGGIHDAVIAGHDVTIGQKITSFLLGSTAEQRAQRNRRAMLELVKNTWVKGVLEQSLHGAAMIELGLEERADAVERPWDMVLQTPDQPNRPLLRGTKIADVFDDMNRALLILGEPGSGKTTMLLELARDTIARAEGDPTQPIPVVFNLSSWAEKRQPITEWLVEELNTKYNIPKRIARPWVENDDLLLLLDGLDEVKGEHREACVRAINAFRQEHGLAPIAVCSRVADYEALTTRLRLQGAVLLQPLTPQQINQYLGGAGTELLAVRKTLQHDPTLQELAQTPLMLSVMTLAYRGIAVEDLGALDAIEARRRHVCGAYVQRMFERRGIDQPYSSEQAIDWLAWLAQKMKQHAQTVFLIERMQPIWLHTDAQRQSYTVIWKWIVRLVVGLIVGPLVGQFAGPILGLIGGIGGAIFVTWPDSGSTIEPVEVLRLSWKQVGRRLIALLSVGLIGTLLCGPYAWLIVILGVVGLSRGLIHKRIETRVVPNQGIRQSAQNTVIVWLITVLIVGLIGGLIGGMSVGLIGVLASLLTAGLTVNPIVGLINWLISGLIVGLIVGALLAFKVGGGSACTQHFTLHFILHRNGCIPWNYARFLDYATERILLRKVGGGYIFVHRLLQEHFATMSTEEVA